jgi:hypothetical protein
MIIQNLIVVFLISHFAEKDSNQNESEPNPHRD